MLIKICRVIPAGSGLHLWSHPRDMAVYPQETTNMELTTLPHIYWSDLMFLCGPPNDVGLQPPWRLLSIELFNYLYM